LQIPIPPRSSRAVCPTSWMVVLVCGLASLGWPRGALSQTDTVFGHVHQATIEADHGVPRVMINGHVRSDWDLPANALGAVRNASGKTGVQTGYYFLNDFLDGIVPPCKAYLFANAFYVTAPEMKTIRERLDREQATAIWQYAPGYLGPEGPSALRSSELIGIQLVVNDGVLTSVGEGSLAGLTWGTGHLSSPRLTVVDADAEPLGRYLSDKTVSAARKQVGHHRSFFFGDIGLGSEVLRSVYEEAGAHVWTRGEEVIQTDGTFLMVHSAEPGACRIEPPAGHRLIPLWGGLEAQAETEQGQFGAESTRWFRIVRD